MSLGHKPLSRRRVLVLSAGAMAGAAYPQRMKAAACF